MRARLGVLFVATRRAPTVYEHARTFSHYKGGLRELAHLADPTRRVFGVWVADDAAVLFFAGLSPFRWRYFLRYQVPGRCRWNLAAGTYSKSFVPSVYRTILAATDDQKFLTTADRKNGKPTCCLIQPWFLIRVRLVLLCVPDHAINSIRSHRYTAIYLLLLLLLLWICLFFCC